MVSWAPSPDTERVVAPVTPPAVVVAMALIPPNVPVELAPMLS